MGISCNKNEGGSCFCHKLARGTIPKAKLVARFDKFAAGQWNDLINEGVQVQRTQPLCSVGDADEIRKL